MTDYIQQAAKANKRSALITDLGSVKDTLVSFFNDVPLENGCRYLGSHPMAGKEVSGAANADDRLFDNCVTVITPGTTRRRKTSIRLPNSGDLWARPSNRRILKNTTNRRRKSAICRTLSPPLSPIPSIPATDCQFSWRLQVWIP